jgi:hypothetical protein
MAAAAILSDYDLVTGQQHATEQTFAYAMQLTLNTPFPPHNGDARSRRPQDAAAVSQLDLIAAQNLRSPSRGLGLSATLLAIVGGLVLVGAASMWNAADEASSRPTAAVVESRAPLAEAPPLTVPDGAPAAAVAAVAALAAAQEVSPAAVEVPPTDAIVSQAQPEPVAQATVAPDAEAAALAAAADARKARARKLAEARRKAAQEAALAQETQRLLLAQQRRDAERVQQQQQQAEQARKLAAAELARAQAAQVAVDSRRGVDKTCAAAGGYISRQFCYARECAQSEQRGDPICVRLRDDEAAQRRASLER